MKQFTILVVIFTLGILTSCETEIPFTGKITEPVLVVNCLANADSIVQVQVSASRFFLTDEDTFNNVSNATVALFVNGTFVENLDNLGQGNYNGMYIAREGDRIKLQVSASGYQPVFSEVIVPYIVSGFSIDSTITKTETSLLINRWDYGGTGIQSDTLGTTYSYIHQFKIHFSDAPGEKNFYRLIVKETTKFQGYESINYQSNFDDLVFGEKKNNLDGIFSESGNDVYSIFSDELIDGKAHTITVSSSKAYNKLYGSTDTTKVDMRVSIDLQSIDKSYYLYLKSLKALDIADQFMSEPVQIYTNIDGGLGIAGAKTNQERSFVLAE